MCDIIFEKMKGVYAAKLNLQTCSFIRNEALVQVFSCEFSKIRKNTFFAEHHQTSASDYNSICKL